MAPLAADAPQLHEASPGNVLIKGRVARGDVDDGAGAVGGHGGIRRRNHVRRARLYRARGGLCAARRRPHRGLRDHADALHGSRRARAHPRPEAGAGAHHTERLRRRLRRQARSVAAAADRDGGLAAEPARAVRLHPPGIDGLHHQAPSRAHDRDLRRRCRGPADGRALPRRFQHRRVRLLGPDGRQPRARACDGSVRGEGRALHHARDLHERSAGRRLPRLRRAAGGDRARGADGPAGREARHRCAGVPPSQRAQGRLDDGNGAQARGERWAVGLPRRAPAPLARVANGRGSLQSHLANPQARRRHWRHVVRHRQHLAVQSVGDGDGRHARRRGEAVQRRRRYRPGLEHGDGADCRRRPGRAA